MRYSLVLRRPSGPKEPILGNMISTLDHWFLVFQQDCARGTIRLVANRRNFRMADAIFVLVGSDRHGEAVGDQIKTPVKVIGHSLKVNQPEMLRLQYNHRILPTAPEKGRGMG